MDLRHSIVFIATAASVFFFSSAAFGQTISATPKASALIAACRTYMGQPLNNTLSFRLQAGVRTAAGLVGSFKSPTLVYYRDRERDLAIVRAADSRRTTLMSSGRFLDYDANERRWTGSEIPPEDIAIFRSLVFTNLYAVLVGEPAALDLDWERIEEAWRFRWVAAALLRDCLEMKFGWLNEVRATSAPVAEKLDGNEVWKIGVAAGGIDRTLWIQYDNKPFLVKAIWREEKIDRTVTLLLNDGRTISGDYVLPNKLSVRFDDDDGRTDVKADFWLSDINIKPLPDDFFSEAAIESKVR